MKDHYFDPTFGIKNVALAIANMIEFSTHRIVSWSPFYNGREKWVCLTVGDQSWVFGEHRNSDQLFIDRLPVIKNQMNPAVLQDCTDAVYKARQFFRFDEHYKVARTIMDEIPA